MVASAIVAPVILALAGKAGAGKSTVAKYLIENYGAELVKFASPLKEMMTSFYKAAGLTPEEIDRRIEGDLKEVPCPLLGGRTPRYAMQTLGTQWGRDTMSKDLWVDAAKAKISGMNASLIIVDDCRFPNEAEAIKSIGGKVVEIVTDTVKREVSNHVSELSLPKRLIANTILNSGTLKDLFNRVDGFIMKGRR